MPKIQYEEKEFRASSLAIIESANKIILEYEEEGISLTLRQLYYQFVARGWIENKQRNYKRLGKIVNDARMTGLIDWYAIEDRTRGFADPPYWEEPSEIIDAAVDSFCLDKWKNQPYRPEVWVEKDALVGIISRAADDLNVGYLSCRGYTSLSEMWRSGRRMKKRLENDAQIPIVIHLGDHDPSGIDMTRDIQERLAVFAEEGIEVKRIALNMDQIDEFGPPPNPAKLTDSRCTGYIKKYGKKAWELDALEPRTMDRIIREAVLVYRDEELWQVMEEEEERGKKAIREMANRLREDD